MKNFQTKIVRTIIYRKLKITSIISTSRWSHFQHVVFFYLRLLKTYSHTYVLIHTLYFIFGKNTMVRRISILPFWIWISYHVIIYVDIDIQYAT